MTPPTWTAEKAEALKRLCEKASPTWVDASEALVALPDALAEIDRLTAQWEALKKWHIKAAKFMENTRDQSCSITHKRAIRHMEEMECEPCC